MLIGCFGRGGAGEKRRRGGEEGENEHHEEEEKRRRRGGEEGEKRGRTNLMVSLSWVGVLYRVCYCVCCSDVL